MNENTKSVRRLRMEKSLEKALAHQSEVAAEKSKLVSGMGISAVFEDFEELRDAVVGLEDQGRQADENVAEFCKRLNELFEIEKHEYNADWESRIAEIDFDVRAEPVKFIGDHVGMMNPLELSTSLRKISQDGRYSLVFLAVDHGALKRIVVSGKEIYDDPESHLGDPIIQTSKGYSVKNIRGVFVVGYIDRSGKKFGYIPNAKFNTYCM